MVRSHLDEKMHQKILFEWNSATADYPRDRCLHQLFEEHVAKDGQATALVCGSAQIDYQTLNARANQLARYLLSNGAKSGQRIALCLHRSIEMVVAIVGVLKAGCTYVPISPAYPKERMAFMLSDAAPALLMTEEPLLEGLPSFQNPTLCIDSLTTELAQQSPHNLDLAIAATEIAYIIYTSGSTGIPKGVEVPHRGTYNTTRAHIDLCGIRPSDRLLQFAAFGFDTSILEILMALGAGAALVLVPQDQLLIGESLARLIDEAGVTVATLQPSVLASLPERELPTLRVLLSAGEACTAQLVRRFAPGREFWNAYGPTEGSVCVTLARLRPEDVTETIPPIGRPIPNTRVYILDEAQQPVAIGEAGELCIGGIAVAKGYLNRPELTQERFLLDPYHPEPGNRLYRTGDLARFRADGQIEFLGRIDHQVKLHGFRIELGEVEAALLRHPSVSHCVVIVREDEPGDRRMCAYVVLHSEAALAVSNLRAFLGSRLPEFMIPSAFVALPALPLTTHGKIDRAALPPPGTARPLLGPYHAPVGELEQQVAAIFASVLHLDEVGATDDFFELGGHSLRAAQVTALIGTRLGVSLPVRTLFAHRTVRALSAYLSTAGAATVVTIPLADRQQRVPLSSSQEQIWLTSLLHATSPLYNEPYAVTIRGPLDTDALTAALQALLVRHEILRTTFEMQNGRPCQRIHDEVTLPVAYHDLRHLPQSEHSHAVRALHDDAARQLFDLQTPPLLRAQLVCLALHEHRLLLVFHHAIFDGVSLANVLLPELFKLYTQQQQGGPGLSPPSLQYADYAAWEQTQLGPEQLAPHLEYWRKQLAALPVLQLPTDHVRPAQGSFRGARLPLHLDSKLSAGLLALAQREGATLYMALVAGLASLLHRYTGQEELPIAGVVSAQQRPELSGLIGPFVNTLVLRIDLAHSPSFRELLNRVRETVLAGLDHSELPFPKLVEELRPERSLGQQPLFQVMCLLDPPGADLPSQWSVSRFESHNGTAMCDFSLQMERRPDGLHGFLEYSRDLFDETTISRWAQHLTVLLSAMVEQPEQPIALLPLLPSAEKVQLAAWTGGIAQPEVTTCLHELFAAKARSTPDVVAVVYEDQRLTYAQLDRAAERLAAQLSALGVGPDQAVGLCAERSLELVVGILGILKAGGAYLPLDPVYPRDRIRFLLEDAKVAVIVAQEQVRRVLPSSYAGAVVSLSLPTIHSLEEEPPPPRIPVQVQPDHLAYIIYTSGSTGNPKGVQVSHRNVVRLFSATQPWFDFTAQDVWCLFHSFAFDFSVWELWGALLYGGRLVVVPYWVSRSPESFYRLLSSEKVTILNQTPSAFYQLIAAEQAMADLADTPLALRQVIFGGEALDLGALRPFIDRHGEDQPVLVNMYGITETTVHVTYYRIRRADCDRPGSVIGVPIPDLRLRVLDRRLQQVPIGIAGELLVGGGGVARGYLNRPQLTAERFIDDPQGESGARLYRSGDWVRYRPDGSLEYLGRIDHQVKIRGFRIELGEIEEAITQHPEVQSALIELREARQGDKRLVAYLVPKTNPNDPELPVRIRSFIESNFSRSTPSEN